MMAIGQHSVPRILVVCDDERRASICQWLEAGYYDLLAVSYADCLDALAEAPVLVVLSTAAETDDPFALCAELAHLPEPERVPVLAICEPEEVELVLASGVDEVITPDMLGPLLGHRVHRLVSESQHVALLKDAERADWRLVEQHSAMTLLIDPQTSSVIEANPAACAFYGYTASMFHDMPLAQLDAAPLRQGMARALRATAAQDTYFVFRHRLATGEVRDVEMYSSPTRVGSRAAVLAIMHDVSQRKSTEASLREQVERYRKIIDNTSDVLFTLAPDATITSLSLNFETSTGFAPEEWIGQSFASLVYPDDLQKALTIFEQLLRGETPPRFELRYLTSIGQPGIGEFVAYPQLHNNTVVGVWGAVRDITRRRSAEMVARDAQALAEALRDTAAALNSTLDRDELLGQILMQVTRVVPADTCNIMLIENGVARIVRWRGYDRLGMEDEVLNMRFVVSETTNMQTMLETGEPFYLPDVDQYPGWVSAPATEWIRSHISVPIRVEGLIIGFLCLDSATRNLYNQTHADRLRSFGDQIGTAIRNSELYEAVRHQAELLESRVVERTFELEHERARLWTILDAMDEGVIYDEALEVRYINRAMSELTGYAMEEWQGYLDLLRPESVSEEDMARWLDQLSAAVERGETWKQEVRLRRKDGTEFDAALTVSLVQDIDGQSIGAVTVVRDISQDKALAEQKARFVAYASHELRTPITNLKTRLYLMRRQPDQFAEHMRILDDLTERMRRLVEDLLDASRFENGTITLQRQNVLLQTLIHRVVQMQEPEATRKRISLIARMPDTPLRIYADPERLVQVITNLVVNGINYTSSGGTVIVSITSEFDERLAPSALISVQDNGIGIAAEHLPFIFQPFFRVNPQVEGSGLGLSIARHVVELHGGEIEVESEPGEGSLFRVRVPLSDRSRDSLASLNAVNGARNAVQSS